MKQVTAHITINGTPLCQHGTTMRRCDVTCGHKSLTSARKAWRELVKTHWWKTVKVVRGHCPESL